MRRQPSIDSFDSLVDPYEDDARTQTQGGSRTPSLFGDDSPPSPRVSADRFPASPTLMTPPMSPTTAVHSSGASSSVRPGFASEEESVAKAASAGLQRRQLEGAAAQKRPGSRHTSNGVTWGFDSSSLSTIRSYQAQSDAGDEYGGNLPSLAQSRKDGRTALPNSLVRRDIEFAVTKLISEKVRSLLIHSLIRT